MESTLTEDHFVRGDPVPPDKIKDILPEEVWSKLQTEMQRIREARKKYAGAPVSQPTNTPPPAAHK
jgi:hypothetical protein